MNQCLSEYSILQCNKPVPDDADSIDTPWQSLGYRDNKKIEIASYPRMHGWQSKGRCHLSWVRFDTRAIAWRNTDKFCCRQFYQLSERIVENKLGCERWLFMRLHTGYPSLVGGDLSTRKKSVEATNLRRPIENYTCINARQLILPSIRMVWLHKALIGVCKLTAY